MIIIVGAGLSGLLTAYRLKKEGLPFKIIEARSRIGGRIHTVMGTNSTPVEMGATWFQEHHKHLIALLNELGISYFEQYMEDTVFYESSSNSSARKIQIPNQAPSYRISDGSSNLINTLYQYLDDDDVLLNHPVNKIIFNKNSVQVIAKDIFEGDTVILSLPPKLWAKKILFEPPLSDDLLNIASNTHTWMEDSIKIGFTYEQPFWLQEQLSGTLFSNVGPITELYDHCNENRTKYALCGFINSTFINLGTEERRARVLQQLKSVFGEKAQAFLDYEECIWGDEEHTYEDSSRFIYPHQNNGNPIFSNSCFNGRLLVSSSESSPEHPGYMEGAVIAANLTAKKIIAGHNVKK